MKSFKQFLTEANDVWWDSQTKEFQQAYIKNHPNSKYAVNAKQNEKPTVKQSEKSTDTQSSKNNTEKPKTIASQVRNMLGFNPMFIDKQANGYRVSLGTFSNNREKNKLLKQYQDIIDDNNLTVRDKRKNMRDFNSNHLDVIIPFNKINQPSKK